MIANLWVFFIVSFYYFLDTSYHSKQKLRNPILLTYYITVYILYNYIIIYIINISHIINVLQYILYVI